MPQYGDANAGLDYSSDGDWTEANMLLGISDGELSQDRLDDMQVQTFPLQKNALFSSRPL